MTFPRKIPLDGEWSFTYTPPQKNGNPPSEVPPEEEFSCRMPVPGYWDDHLDGLRAAEFHHAVAGRAEEDVAVHGDGRGAVAGAQIAQEEDVPAAENPPPPLNAPKRTATLVVEPTLLTTKLPF